MSMLAMRRRAILGGAFSPAQIAGLSGWWKADEGLYSDTARTTPSTAGGAIAAWSDLSGKGFHATQATAAKRPTLQTAIVNGKPVVRFDGVDDWLETASAQLVGADGTWTAFSVAKPQNTTGIKLIASHDNGGSVRVAQFLRYNAAALETVTFDTAGGNAAVTGGAVSGFDLLEAKRTATTLEAFLNGTSVVQASPAGAPKSAAVALHIGAYRGASEFMNGDIAELLIYNRALTTTEQSDIRSYIAGRFGTL